MLQPTAEILFSRGPKKLGILEMTCMHACMHACMDGCMDAWMHGHGCMDAWMHGCMDAWMHGWMDGWMDGSMDGWMDDGWMYLCMYVCMYHIGKTRSQYERGLIWMASRREFGVVGPVRCREKNKQNPVDNTGEEAEKGRNCKFCGLRFRVTKNIT